MSLSTCPVMEKGDKRQETNVFSAFQSRETIIQKYFIDKIKAKVLSSFRVLAIGTGFASDRQNEWR